MNPVKLKSRWIRGDNAFNPEKDGYNGYTVLYITNTANVNKNHSPQVVYQGDNGYIWSLPLDKWPGNLIPEPKKCINRYILSICLAYEQGVGKGRSKGCKQNDNPYITETLDEYEAWDYGWREGNNWLTQRIEKPIKE